MHAVKSMMHLLVVFILIATLAPASATSDYSCPGGDNYVETTLDVSGSCPADTWFKECKCKDFPTKRSAYPNGGWCGDKGFMTTWDENPAMCSGSQTCAFPVKYGFATGSSTDASALETCTDAILSLRNARIDTDVDGSERENKLLLDQMSSLLQESSPSGETSPEDLKESEDASVELQQVQASMLLPAEKQRLAQLMGTEPLPPDAPNEVRVARAAVKHGGKLIGGFVRDWLMRGETARDVDVKPSSSSPECDDFSQQVRQELGTQGTSLQKVRLDCIPRKAEWCVGKTSIFDVNTLEVTQAHGLQVHAESPQAVLDNARQKKATAQLLRQKQKACGHEQAKILLKMRAHGWLVESHGRTLLKPKPKMGTAGGESANLVAPPAQRHDGAHLGETFSGQTIPDDFVAMIKEELHANNWATFCPDNSADFEVYVETVTDEYWASNGFFISWRFHGQCVGSGDPSTEENNGKCYGKPTYKHYNGMNYKNYGPYEGRFVAALTTCGNTANPSNCPSIVSTDLRWEGLNGPDANSNGADPPTECNRVKYRELEVQMRAILQKYRFSVMLPDYLGTARGWNAAPTASPTPPTSPPTTASSSDDDDDD